MNFNYLWVIVLKSSPDLTCLSSSQRINVKMLVRVYQPFSHLAELEINSFYFSLPSKIVLRRQPGMSFSTWISEMPRLVTENRAELPPWEFGPSLSKCTCDLTQFSFISFQMYLFCSHCSITVANLVDVQQLKVWIPELKKCWAKRQANILPF